MRRFVIAALILTAGLGCGPGDPETPRIDRLHPDFDQVVPDDAEIRLLVDGHEWTEGPVWVPQLDALLYSEIPTNTIYRWTEAEGETLWLRPSGYTGDVPRGGELGSNGLAIGPDGSLLLAQHGDRRIARLDAPWDAPEARFTTLAGEHEGRRFSSPNDLVIARNGDIYFTDPPYGLEQRDEDPGKEMEVDGVYRLSPDGVVTRVIDDLRRPNGVALSPDETTLYVSTVGSIWAYEVAPDGSLSGGYRFRDGGGDGLAVDQDGRLYIAASRAGVLVYDADGTHLGSLVPGDRTSNVAFGDDGSTLYVTGVQFVSIRVLTKGLGFTD